MNDKTKGYAIFAYDKDSDRLDLVVDMRGHEIRDDALPRAVMNDISKLVKEEQLLAPDRQPYDWVELHKDDVRIAVA